MTNEKPEMETAEDGVTNASIRSDGTETGSNDGEVKDDMEESTKDKIQGMINKATGNVKGK